MTGTHIQLSSIITKIYNIILVYKLNPKGKPSKTKGVNVCNLYLYVNNQYHSENNFQLYLVFVRKSIYLCTVMPALPKVTPCEKEVHIFKIRCLQTLKQYTFT